MNKAKGEEIRGFLRYLEREIGVGIDNAQKQNRDSKLLRSVI